MTTEYFDNSSSILSSTEKCDILPQTTDGGEPSKPSKQTPGFDFHAQHNNAACIHNLDPKVKGTPSEFWHTISMYVGLFHESQKTIQNNIDSLFSNGELVERKNLLTTVVIEDSLGRGHSVVIYNLEVLNKLAMLCFKGNPYAQEIRNKFSDILTAYETGVSVDPAPSVPDFTKLTRREILQMALDAEIAKEEAEKKLALSSQELDDEKEDHRHDNCVKNGRAGGLTKNRNFHQARADAAEARAYEAETKTEEQAKTIDELKERLMNELEDWKTARDFCEPTRFSFYDYTLKYRISEDLVRVSAILHITWKRGEYSRQFRKQAFDVLLHHFCCDPTYLKEWRHDWHEDMYKYGALSRECGDKLEGTPDILEGLV